MHLKRLKMLKPSVINLLFKRSVSVLSESTADAEQPELSKLVVSFV